MVFQSIKGWFQTGCEEEKGISVICAYNNLKKLNDYLIPSLNRQTTPFELLSIDNTRGNLTSAPAILNATAKKAKYEYLMFAHQDVALDSNNWLVEVERNLRSLYRLGAAGVAGKSKSGLAASVSHGIPPQFVGTKRLNKPVQVQTLDGCLIIVPKKVFNRISFDEMTIKGWYLYVADYCLDLICLGYRNYVLPHQIYHESTGPHDPSVYEETLKNITEKHRNHTKMIYTTMGDWRT
jgi:hypothetical protein